MAIVFDGMTEAEVIRKAQMGDAGCYERFTCGTSVVFFPCACA